MGPRFWRPILRRSRSSWAIALIRERIVRAVISVLPDTAILSRSATSGSRNFESGLQPTPAVFRQAQQSRAKHSGNVSIARRLQYDEDTAFGGAVRCIWRHAAA